MLPFCKVEYQDDIEVTIVSKKDQVARVSSPTLCLQFWLMVAQEFKKMVKDHIVWAKLAADKATCTRAKTHLVSAPQFAVCSAPDCESSW